MGEVYPPRCPVLVDLERRYQVETKAREVGEVFRSELVAVENGVNVAKTPKLRLTATVTTQIGKVDALWLTHEDVFDLATTVDEDADLTADFPRNPSDVSSQLGTQDALGGDFAAKGAFECAALARLESGGIPGDLVLTNEDPSASIGASPYRLSQAMPYLKNGVAQRPSDAQGGVGLNSAARK